MAKIKPALEVVELILFSEAYKNRRILITGHTGFKGSWLALWLKNLGAHVTGLSLAPTNSPNHWNLLNLSISENIIDICDKEAVLMAVKKADPEIVFHLAAQSLVRHSYISSVETWNTNVMGSVYLMEACRSVTNLRAVIFVTTDKCYENKESRKGYTEEDSLGGHDPYSASKASTEFVASSYRDSFFKGLPLIATVRAGNVIGGGDWAVDRIVPDLARAQVKGLDLVVRSPDAVRPWQHVLEPLSGYLQLGQKLLEQNKDFQGAWNFGPEEKDALSVSDLLTHMKAKWIAQPDNQVHETKILLLDSTKANEKLGWRSVLTINEQISMTADWYKEYQSRNIVITRQQLDNYQTLALKRNAAWS